MLVRQIRLPVQAAELLAMMAVVLCGVVVVEAVAIRQTSDSAAEVRNTLRLVEVVAVA